jgi:hypothetical protein
MKASVTAANAAAPTRTLRRRIRTDRTATTLEDDGRTFAIAAYLNPE